MGPDPRLWRDRRWQRRRLETLAAAAWRCQHPACPRPDAPEIPLAVHHLYYAPGRPPWDYPPAALRVLCAECHARVHGLTAPLPSE
jgi:hypothetical protein